MTPAAAARTAPVCVGTGWWWGWGETRAGWMCTRSQRAKAGAAVVVSNVRRRTTEHWKGGRHDGGYRLMGTDRRTQTTRRLDRSIEIDAIDRWLTQLIGAAVFARWGESVSPSRHVPAGMDFDYWRMRCGAPPPLDASCRPGRLKRDRSIRPQAEPSQKPQQSIEDAFRSMHAHPAPVD